MPYIGIAGTDRGKLVQDEEAWGYALEACGLSVSNWKSPMASEVRKALIEWYFSGSWIYVDPETYENEKLEFSRSIDKEMGA